MGLSTDPQAPASLESDRHGRRIACGRAISTPDFDPLALLRMLIAHQVRFVLIGGFAGAIRGSPVITGDVEICYAR